LSRLGAHILTGTLLDRHARQHLGEQSCTNPLSFSFSPDCSLVASTTASQSLLGLLLHPPLLATHSMASRGWWVAAACSGDGGGSHWKRARRDRTSKKHDSRNMHTNNNFKKQITLPCLEKARREVANHCNFCLAIMTSGHAVSIKDVACHFVVH
jgi:hypothetical protein